MCINADRSTSCDDNAIDGVAITSQDVRQKGGKLARHVELFIQKTSNQSTDAYVHVFHLAHTHANSLTTIDGVLTQTAQTNLELTLSLISVYNVQERCTIVADPTRNQHTIWIFLDGSFYPDRCMEIFLGGLNELTYVPNPLLITCCVGLIYLHIFLAISIQLCPFPM